MSNEAIFSTDLLDFCKFKFSTVIELVNSIPLIPACTARQTCQVYPFAG